MDEKAKAAIMFLNAKTEADMMAACARCIELGLLLDLGRTRTVLGGELRSFELTPEGQLYLQVAHVPEPKNALCDLVTQAENKAEDARRRWTIETKRIDSMLLAICEEGKEDE